MTSRFCVFIFMAMVCFNADVASQNVGIGTNNPGAGLHVVSNNGVIFKGTFLSGAVLDEKGEGSRFIFNPGKAATRSGGLSSLAQNYWNDSATGWYSVAMGSDVSASGYACISMGQSNIASGINSTALGYEAKAEGSYSFALSCVGAATNSDNTIAIGSEVNANTYGSVAVGSNVNAGIAGGNNTNCFAIGVGQTEAFNSTGHFALGIRSFAFGNNCQSVGNQAFAIGNDCGAGGDFYNSSLGRYAFAIGNSCRASGIFSFAFGNNANTNGHEGAMVLGSRVDGVAVVSPADHHFLAQFQGGYQLQSNLVGTLGVYLNPNATSWGSLCDSTKKELVLPMNDDQTLEKLAAINYSSWKYRDDPDAQNRHYGIMAQDFFAAFGKDELGTIGNDTLVNPIDLIGVAYSAIKALEKRTSDIEQLKNENRDLKARLEKLEAVVAKK